MRILAPLATLALAAVSSATAACATTTTASAPLVLSEPIGTSPAPCRVTGATVLVDEASPGASRAMLGIVTHDASAKTFDESPLGDRSGAAGAMPAMRAPLGRPSGPEVLVPLDGDRSLLIYVDNVSPSPRLRAQPIASWGEAIGTPFDISPSAAAGTSNLAAVRGPIRVALSPTGEGLVSYALKDGARVDLAATPIACAPR